jgi:hypothetical protein
LAGLGDPPGQVGGPLQLVHRGASEPGRLVTEGAQGATGVADHGVGLPGDPLGDVGEVSVGPLHFGQLVLGAAAQVGADRAGPRRTTPTGNVGYGEWTIGLGRVWGRTQVRVLDHGATIEIYSADSHLIRTVKPDHTRTYLRTGHPRGRPHRRDNV